MKRWRNIDAISLIVFCALIGEVALLLFQTEQIRRSTGGGRHSSSLRVGRVTQKEGLLKQRGQQHLSWHSIEVGAPVFLSDSILTGSNGRAVVWLDDETLIELGVETLIKISRNQFQQDGKETWVIQLQQGATNVSGGGFVKIRSGEFEADLSKGAKLSLDKKLLDSKPKVLVAEGAVRWKSPQQSALTAKDQIQEKPASTLSPPVFPADTNVSESVIVNSPALKGGPPLSPSLSRAPKTIHTKRGGNKKFDTNPPPPSTLAIDPVPLALPTEQTGDTAVVPEIAVPAPSTLAIDPVPVALPTEQAGDTAAVPEIAVSAPSTLAIDPVPVALPTEQTGDTAAIPEIAVPAPSTLAIDPVPVALPTEQAGDTAAVPEIAVPAPSTLAIDPVTIEAPMVGGDSGSSPVIENRELLAPTLGMATHPPFTRIDLFGKTSRTITGDLMVPVTFHWVVVPVAIGYLIQIAEIPTFEIVLSSLEVQTSPLTINLKSPGDYFWRVSAISPDRKVSEWSKMGKLSMEQIPDSEDDIDSGE